MAEPHEQVPILGWLSRLARLAFPDREPHGLPPKAVPATKALRGTDPIYGLPLRKSGVARRWSFSWAHGQYEAMGQVREAVIGFKFSGQYHQRPYLVAWLKEGFDYMAAGEEWDGFVPVPLHRLRKRERGFNQAEELALGLSEATEIPLLQPLQRVVATRQQALLTRAQRWENIRGAFSLAPKADVKGKRLILIDDVLTTGATVETCARVLKKAGAAEVAVLTVARG